MASLFGGSSQFPRNARGGIGALLLPFAVLAAIFFVVRSTPVPEGPPSRRTSAVFVPTFERLPPVPGGHYEIWAERPDGGAFRLGAFVALPGGSLLTVSGEPVQAFPLPEVPPSGSVVRLTVEEGEELAGSRSGRVLLEGTLEETKVSLRPTLPAVEGVQRAMLLAPTDAQEPDTAGIWFAFPSGTKGKPSAGLALPARDDGWAYGGFVTTAAGTVLPTGRFADPQGPDGAAPFAGARPGLKFPGEDFVAHPPEGTSFPPNLADGRTVLAVSLLPDFGEEPTAVFLPFLEARIPYQQKTGTAFTLAPVADDQRPSGAGVFEQRAE